METLRGVARKWAALQRLERGKRMGMLRTKKSVWHKLKLLFMRFNMCKCIEPKYEVLNGVLSCNICSKPASWQAQSK